MKDDIKLGMPADLGLMSPDDPAIIKQANKTLIRYAGRAVTDRKPIEWLIKGFLAKGAFVVLSGAAKEAMKSITTMHMAICLARGVPFLGLEVTRPCHVWMVNLEDGYQLMVNRLCAFGVQPDDPMPLGLLTDESLYSNVIELAKIHRPDVLFIDPFLEVELMTVGLRSENDALDVGRVLKDFRQLSHSELLISIVLTHHSGSSSKSDLRGSSAFKGSSDGWILAKKDKKKGTRKLIWTPRGAEAGSVGYRVEFSKDSILVDAVGAPVYGDSESAIDEEDEDESGSPPTAESYMRVCSVLQNADGPLSKESIRKLAKVKTATVKEYIERLSSQGLITETKGRWVWNRQAQKLVRSFLEDPADVQAAGQGRKLSDEEYDAMLAGGSPSSPSDVPSGVPSGEVVE